MVAVEVYASMAKYGLLKTEDPEGTAWYEVRHGFSVQFFGPSRRTVCVRIAQSQASGPKSLVSLGSVVLLQRTLIWILRAIEVEAHAIPQNGWIPGCAAEGRTTNRGLCVFIRRIPVRRRVRADPTEPCFSRGILAILYSPNFKIIVLQLYTVMHVEQVVQSGTS